MGTDGIVLYLYHSSASSYMTVYSCQFHQTVHQKLVNLILCKLLKPIYCIHVINSFQQVIMLMWFTLLQIMKVKCSFLTWKHCCSPNCNLPRFNVILSLKKIIMINSYWWFSKVLLFFSWYHTSFFLICLHLFSKFLLLFNYSYNFPLFALIYSDTPWAHSQTPHCYQCP